MRPSLPAKGSAKAAVLADLRRRIARIERPVSSAAGLVLGLPAFDEALSGGLPEAAIHEVIRSGESGDDAATAFGAALLARLAERRDGHVLWLEGGRDLYPPGLLVYGLTPDRLLLLQGIRGRDLLWALEEALKSGALAGVIAETDRLPPVAGRRLQLAAEQGRTTGLLLRPAPQPPVSSALTRWRITALDSHLSGPGVGQPRWRVELLHNRGGRTAEGIVTWTARGWREESVPAWGEETTARRTA